MLREYYERTFPCSDIFDWLNTHSHTPSHREWSFSGENDGYKRYLSFSNSEMLRQMLSCEVPTKLDIGAIYTGVPMQSGSHIPAQRELTIDIDLTDYDNVRTCCSGTNVCAKCWKFVKVAVRILQHMLTEHFDFKHILWVFSGRRGVHAWICDESVSKMNNTIRKQVSEYLILNKKTTFDERGRLHPSLAFAKTEIASCFEEMMIQEQGILNTKERYQSFVVEQIASWEMVRLEQIQAMWTPSTNGIDLWNRLKRVISKQSLLWLYLYCLFPRIDKHVTASVNHLLKSPFCIHPRTGYICLPIVKIEEFDPTDTPSLNSLKANAKHAKAFREGKVHLLKFVSSLKRAKIQGW